jgi:hypothetical protein
MWPLVFDIAGFSDSKDNDGTAASAAAIKPRE